MEKKLVDMTLSELVDHSLAKGLVPIFQFIDKDKMEEPKVILHKVNDKIDSIEVNGEMFLPASSFNKPEAPEQSNEFVWTDDLIQEYVARVILSSGYNSADKMLQDFKKSKQQAPSTQPSKDLEVVSCILETGEVHAYDKEFCLGADKSIKCEIYSVKRNSDGEVFTIGEIGFEWGEIKAFIIVEHELYVEFEHRRLPIISVQKSPSKSESHIPKEEKPLLFVTEDGAKITDDYEGGIWRIFIGNSSFESWRPYDLGIPDFYNEDEKYFLTKQSANEYVLMNAPRFSINDVKGCYGDDRSFVGTQFLIDQLKKLSGSKQGLPIEENKYDNNLKDSHKWTKMPHEEKQFSPIPDIKEEKITVTLKRQTHRDPRIKPLELIIVPSHGIAEWKLPEIKSAIENILNQ